MVGLRRSAPRASAEGGSPRPVSSRRPVGGGPCCRWIAAVFGESGDDRARPTAPQESSLPRSTSSSLPRSTSSRMRVLPSCSFDLPPPPLCCCRTCTPPTMPVVSSCAAVRGVNWPRALGGGGGARQCSRRPGAVGKWSGLAAARLGVRVSASFSSERASGEFTFCRQRPRFDRCPLPSRGYRQRR
jgi:hypothetical protein